MRALDGGGHGREAMRLLVDALELVPSMRDPDSRRLCLQLLRRQLGNGFQVEENTTARKHIYSIALTCDGHEDGLRVLVSVLDDLEPRSGPVQRVRQLVDDLSPLDLFPSQERQGLLDLLAEVTLPRLAEVYRAAVGPFAGELPVSGTDPRELFVALEQLNSRPDGLPPTLALLEHCAAQVGAELAGRLREWSTRQAAAMGLADALGAVRAQISATSIKLEKSAVAAEAYLVIRLQRAGLDQDRYLLRHWRQSDPTVWRPQPGEEITTTLDEAPRQVADLVDEAERGWAAEAEKIRIEFVLPRELLSLPVDRWLRDPGSPLPQPLGLRYEIVVRSLDRMRARQWHRDWRLRWRALRALQGQAPFAEQLACWATSVEPQRLRELEAVLAKRDEVVMLVLGTPPAPARELVADEILVGLRAGLPVLLWNRDEGLAGDFDGTLRPILGAARTDALPGIIRELRADAFSFAEPETKVGSHTTILWDDPERLVEPVDTPAAPAGPKRGEGVAAP